MADTAPVRVLLVEDSTTDARLLMHELARMTAPGFEVARVECLADALAKLQAEPFDVALLDLTLPDSSGIATIFRVQHVARELPIIVLTGVSDEAVGNEAIRAGTQDYLVKGEANGTAVARAIRYAAERKRGEEAQRRLTAELEQRIREASVANESLRESRRAALNLMEDELKARREAEHMSAERESTVKFLQLINESRGTKEIVHSALDFFKRESACEAVGIRLKSGEDYPYYETVGFPPDFVRTETSLCARSPGSQLAPGADKAQSLECLCGSVICSRLSIPNPSVSKHGSYWTNSTTEAPFSISPGEMPYRIRSRCTDEGYESVALIPLQVGGVPMGLVQLNDKTKDRFALDSIALWERLADYLASALEKIRLEEELRVSEERFRLALAHAPVSVAVQDKSLQFVWSYNQRTRRSEDIVGKFDADLFSAPDVERLVALKQRVLETGSDAHERMWVLSGEKKLYLDLFVEPVRDEAGQIIGVGVASVDLTQMKRAEEQLVSLNRNLRALSISTQAMMRATDEAGYLAEVCRIVVEECGHAMVWIGYAQDNEARSITPVAHYGFDEGYLDKLGTTWGSDERGLGPTGTAVRTGQPAVCRYMLTDPAFEPWREEAVKRGYASSVALPLLGEGRAFGALTIYSRQPDSFAEDEIRLMAELAADLSHGINAIRLRASRDLAEETLRKERNFSNAIVQTTGGLIVGLDVTGCIQIFNHACEKTTGYAFNEVAGRPFWDFLLLPEEKEAVKNLFGQIKDGAASADMEFENYWVAKNGARHFIRWANSALRDENGKATLIIGTGIDITERSAMEGQLRFQANALAQVADAIIMVDTDYNVLYMNGAAARLYDVKPGMSRNLGELYTPKWINSGDEERSEHDLAVRGSWSGENIHVKQSGEELWVHSNVVVVRDKEGTQTGLLGVIRDISELAKNRKKIEELNAFLEQKANDLTLANKELEAFSYSVSHDLRNPLHGIVSCVEALKSAPASLDADSLEAIGHIEKSTYRMSQVINDLLSLSRITQQELKRDRVDLTYLAECFFRDLQRSNPDRSVRFEAAPNLTAMADSGLVTILLENLLRNAWKFTSNKQDAVIVVGALDTAEPVTYFVRDNGAGFNMAMAEKLFMPFKRLHSEKEFNGTGIGLATVKRIVDKHGGKVWAEGEVGKGATVYFRLAAAPGH